MISTKKRHPQTSRPTPPRTRAHTVSTNPGYPQHTPLPVPQLHPTKRHRAWCRRRNANIAVAGSQAGRLQSPGDLVSAQVTVARRRWMDAQPHATKLLRCGGDLPKSPSRNGVIPGPSSARPVPNCGSSCPSSSGTSRPEDCRAPEGDRLQAGLHRLRRRVNTRHLVTGPTQRNREEP